MTRKRHKQPPKPPQTPEEERELVQHLLNNPQANEEDFFVGTTTILPKPAPYRKRKESNEEGGNNDEKHNTTPVEGGGVGANPPHPAASAGREENGPRPPRKRREYHRVKMTKRMRRQLLVARMLLQGRGIGEIAEELGVTRGTVNNDIRRLYDEWKAEISKSVDELRARELARIDQLEREYWAAWERSIEAEVKSVEVREDAGGGKSTTRKVKKWAIGKIEFLHGIQWCIEKRVEILGLNAPQRIDQRHLIAGTMAVQGSTVNPEAVNDQVLRGIVRVITQTTPKGDE